MTQRFERIYADHREAVRAYVKRRAPEALVDDVVSETFVVCLRRIDRVPPQPLPWLYAVAWKTLANERRKQARIAHSHELPVAAPEPVGDGVLATAFNSLNERDGEVLRLVAWEGLSAYSTGSVRSSIRRPPATRSTRRPRHTSNARIARSQTDSRARR
jgi:RNA polymerase sigma-70 factor (ECF subfamily)